MRELVKYFVQRFALNGTVLIMARFIAAVIGIPFNKIKILTYLNVK